MLAGELEYADGMIQRLPDALNDVVIGHGNVGKLVRVDMSINGYFVQQYPGDGIVVSTPTGSTGYTFPQGAHCAAPCKRHDGNAYLSALIIENTPCSQRRGQAQFFRKGQSQCRPYFRRRHDGL